eukprot:TRINITY_DN3480_c0_g1_i1.p1 TRINITY_DN3480_c0_g1~~TRINITY_DN3480_c0_g1_i1.p1  ORF type:complete len:498 (-),score=153.69 TRINITY_DN3480_c0_g1_i1:47-1540(-)
MFKNLFYLLLLLIFIVNSIKSEIYFPEEESVMYEGLRIPIKWDITSFNNEEDIKIDLYEEGPGGFFNNYLKTITISTSNDGEYKWDINTDDVSTVESEPDYYLLLTQGEVSISSNTFSIISRDTLFLYYELDTMIVAASKVPVSPTLDKITFELRHSNDDDNNLVYDSTLVYDDDNSVVFFMDELESGQEYQYRYQLEYHCTKCVDDTHVLSDFTDFSSDYTLSTNHNNLCDYHSYSALFQGVSYYNLKFGLNINWCGEWNVIFEHDITPDFAFILENLEKNLVLAVFRGTELSNLTDWIDNISSFSMIECESSGCKTDGSAVGFGFQNAFDDSNSVEISSIVQNKAINENRDILFTGHSQGAAIAVIAAVEISQSGDLFNPVVHTYGSPSVGNEEFKTDYDNTVSDSVRYVLRTDDDAQDIISLTGPIGSVHVEEPTYLFCEGIDVDLGCHSSLGYFREIITPEQEGNSNDSNIISITYLGLFLSITMILINYILF